MGYTLKKYTCIEHTYDYDYADFNIRLWIDAKEVSAIKHDYSLTIAKIIDKNNDFCAIVRRLADIPNVNALQIRDRHKQAGIMVYTVPF